MLDDDAVRKLFTDARTPTSFSSRPVARETIQRIYELSVLGPTASNSVPLRLVVVESTTGKARLLPSSRPRNVAKIMQTPVTLIMAADLRFYEEIPRLWPDEPENADKFKGPANVGRATQFAMMNATLQGAYFMLAARAVGLDVAPMGIENKALLDAEFFLDGRYASLWLVGLGYASDEPLPQRYPRLAFEEAARFV
jgi:3-hydroxypropanoate dehydrogenase